jgi:hypothetical protein
VVKNGSKTCATISGGMPVPVSETVIVALAAWLRVLLACDIGLG